MPISKMNLCSRFLRLSVPALSNEKPQMAMCDVECCGRLSFGLLVWMRPCHLSQHCGGVRENGRLVVFCFANL